MYYVFFILIAYNEKRYFLLWVVHLVCQIFPFAIYRKIYAKLLCIEKYLKNFSFFYLYIFWESIYVCNKKNPIFI